MFFWPKCSPSIADWSLNVAYVSTHRKKISAHKNRSNSGPNQDKIVDDLIWSEIVDDLVSEVMLYSYLTSTFVPFASLPRTQISNIFKILKVVPHGLLRASCPSHPLCSSSSSLATRSINILSVEIEPNILNFLLCLSLPTSAESVH